MNIQSTLITSVSAGTLAVGMATAWVNPAFSTVIAESLCVGFDCGSPTPPFGFDTIRIMENNLRFLAMDTSTVSGFPTRDWQIEFNSSSSGGGNYFMIRDCGNTATTASTCNGTAQFTIEGGADNESIHVDSAGNQGGNVGFGTAVPVVDLHALSGNTPTLRLEQDASSGFTPQSWDLAGNESNFFIRDVTNGSALPFRIEPGTASNTLYLDNQERIGINTTAPADLLHLRSPSGPVAIRLESTAVTAPNPIRLNFNTAQNEFRITYDGLGVNQLRLTSAGNLIIAGQITTSGSCSGGCDLVFDPDYDLPSIDQHADEMWKNRHLPAVGPTPESGPFNLSEKVGGMLNELEKAHIYIEQLNNEKKAIQSELDALRYRIATMEASLRR